MCAFNEISLTWSNSEGLTKLVLFVFSGSLFSPETAYFCKEGQEGEGKIDEPNNSKGLRSHCYHFGIWN